jgi:hypothetical protein
MNDPGMPRPAVNVTRAVVPLKQCAAVVTMRLWIKVPVQPFTSTVLGHPQGADIVPPTTGATVTAGAGVALADSSGSAGAHERSATTDGAAKSHARARGSLFLVAY